MRSSFLVWLSGTIFECKTSSLPVFSRVRATKVINKVSVSFIVGNMEDKRWQSTVLCSHCVESGKEGYFLVFGKFNFFLNFEAAHWLLRGT